MHINRNDPASAIVIPIVKSERATWSSVFTFNHNKQTQFVSIHYPKLFFYTILFLIPFLTSISLLFVQDIFIAFARDENTRGIGFSFLFKIFSFSFKMNDLDITTPSPYSSTTSYTYWQYCALPPTTFAFFKEHKVIDDLFCSWIWHAVQILTITSIFSGLVFIILLIDNILVWSGRSFWFDPRVKSTKSVKHVRRSFKLGMMGCISFHFIAQTMALGICSWILRSGVKLPSRLTGYFGFYGGWTSVFLDLLFLVLFNYSDKMTFFHVPMDVHVDKSRGFTPDVSI